MSTIIRVLDAANGQVLTEKTHPETHVRDVVAVLRDDIATAAGLGVTPAVTVVLLRQPSDDALSAMPPAELADLQKQFGTPPRIPFKTWPGKTAAELADRLEEQCDRLDTPEGITATLDGLAMELAMFGSLVAICVTTVYHAEEDGQHMLKTTNSLRIMDKRLITNPAAVAHLRTSIANSVEFVRDSLDRQLGKPSGNTLTGPNGELLP